MVADGVHKNCLYALKAFFLGSYGFLSYIVLQRKGGFVPAAIYCSYLLLLAQDSLICIWQWLKLSVSVASRLFIHIKDSLRLKKGKEIGTKEPLMESVTCRKADVKGQGCSCGLILLCSCSSSESRFVLKCTRVCRHIVPPCMWMIVGTAIASCCGMEKQPRNVTAFVLLLCCSLKTVQASVKCCSELQFVW